MPLASVRLAPREVVKQQRSRLASRETETCHVFRDRLHADRTRILE